MPNRKLEDLIGKRQLVTASKRESIKDVAHKMASFRVGAVLIMEKNKLIGIVTERDLVQVVALGLPQATAKVETIMTNNPMTIDSEKSFCHALHIMDDNNFRHLPVTKDGNVIGMVSARDALAMDLKQFESDNALKEHIYSVIA